MTKLRLKCQLLRVTIFQRVKSFQSYFKKSILKYHKQVMVKYI